MLAMPDHIPPVGTYLGFDFGTRYLGVAVGQSITKTASPLITLRANHGQPQWDHLAKILKEWEPRGLIVGLALQADGSASPTSLAAQKFARRLQGRFTYPVYFIEERLTSIAAQAKIRETVAFATSSVHRDRDAQAAAILLASWLNNEFKQPYAYHDTSDSTESLITMRS